MIKQLVDPNKLCMGCMNIVESTDAPCPYCGFLLSAYIGSEKCLQPYEILNGKYMVGRVLGIGGFGITYIGWDFYQCKKSDSGSGNPVWSNPDGGWRTRISG